MFSPRDGACKLSEISSWLNSVPKYEPFILSDNSKNLGSASLRWANIFTGDLHLSNEGQEGGNNVDGTTGNWTIQEGNDSLYIVNNKNGKKYKFKLEEI